MSAQTVTGRHYLTGKTISVSVEEGIISAIEDTEDGEDQWLAPGLIDLQINGYAGVDFQRDGVSAERLREASAGLNRDGCSRWLLTLITDEWSSLMARLRHFKALRDADEDLRKSIVGWHVEGPFLSPEPGYRGAHPPEVMCDPTPENLDELRSITGDDPVLITVASERSTVNPQIPKARELGFVVSIGHSNASSDELKDAVAQGATGFTHLSNGMPQQMDRHDNIVGRVFDTPGLTAGVIPDTIHVSPQMFRMIHKVMPSDAIYYTTDAMSAGGAPPGRYTVGRIELEVGEDQVVRMPGQTNFAGSALSPIDGIRRAAKMLGLSWRDVWDYMSGNAARFMGLPVGLEAGAPADFRVIEEEGDDIRICR
ncbi:MAG: N-acetylglucosamine-6-phosphate deacetylase [Verrucomicrobiales bacterium]|nr:N-acetylglucosamine-6-phosphate deacetylase [Verrucomicrobiales bacterium]|tara:strand:- start:4526 stop:5632 length:1107 start_codon:yes stop_codon:yes gene_type:complete